LKNPPVFTFNLPVGGTGRFFFLHSPAGELGKQEEKSNPNINVLK